MEGKKGIKMKFNWQWTIHASCLNKLWIFTSFLFLFLLQGTTHTIGFILDCQPSTTSSLINSYVRADIIRDLKFEINQNNVVQVLSLIYDYFFLTINGAHFWLMNFQSSTFPKALHYSVKVHVWLHYIFTLLYHARGLEPFGFELLLSCGSELSMALLCVVHVIAKTQVKFLIALWRILLTRGK